MTSELSQAQVVIVDTSVVVNFAKAGALRPFATVLGQRVRITRDVYDELATWARSLRPIADLLGTRPWAEPVELTPDQAQTVTDILGFMEGQDTRAQLQDVGEVSSVVLAQHLRDTSGAGVGPLSEIGSALSARQSGHQPCAQLFL